MSSANSKILIFGTLALVAAGMLFAAMQFSTETEQRDPMSEFKAAPTTVPVSSAEVSGAQIAPVDVLLVGLRQRLEQQPDDVDGWVLLSKSYYHLQRRQEAQAAFEKAKALGYVGRWQPLPRIDAYSQGDSATRNFSSKIDFSEYGNTPDGAQAAAGSGSSGSGGVKLKVSLDPTLHQQLANASAVFVFVRAADIPGPPLAVVRKGVGELPFEVALNDSHAMIPGKTISSVDKIIVGARISVTGSPARQPGDYEKLSDSIPADFGDTVELVISEKI